MPAKTLSIHTETNTHLVLDVNNWAAGFGSKVILNNINLGFQRNKITSIVGPSGSGKSTLLRCINRINEESYGFKCSGSILFNGHDIYAKDIDIFNLRSRIGMVFQRPCVFPGSIMDNVVFGLRYSISKAEKLEIVETTLKYVGLWEQVSHRLRKSPQELSVGQQQKLCIARTLAMKSEVILLDEPTSSLDPVSSNTIEHLLLELRGNYTVICVTHNIQQAKKISDHIVFMSAGEVVESGGKEDMINNPLSVLTRNYFKSHYSSAF